MENDLIRTGEGLLKRLESANKFSSKYGTYPYQEANRILAEMKTLADALPDTENPENQDELIQSELNRRLRGYIFSLEQIFKPKYYDFDTVLLWYDIPKADLEGVRDWLLANKERTFDAIDRLFQTKDVQNYELRLQFDIPMVRRQAEEFAAVHIQKYHKKLGKLLQDLTQVGNFLRSISAVPTTEERSYFSPLTRNLAIGIPAICFTTEDGNLQVRERELISLYGHEGMGHGLQQVITKDSSLPFFLKVDASQTAATSESIAQFYEKVIFEDLRDSPETQTDLGIQHKFEEIYQEAKDIAQLQEYKSKYIGYGIIILGDKSLGEPQDQATLKRKIELLSEVAIEPSSPLHFVEQHRHNFDSQGNLSSSLVAELRYCAQPVQRALEEFARLGIKYDEKAGRNKIDEVLLNGFWTPTGYVANARLRARENK